MNHSLRIVTWNANGLTERRQEILTFLQIEKIDIALISETRFTAKSHFTLDKYTVYTTNHPSGNSHGGTAIIIKNNIKHHEIDKYSTDKIQATSIKVHSDKAETTMSAIYCPPRHNVTKNDYKKYFSSLNSRFICGGDWNAKHTYWGSRLITHRGSQLHDTVQNLNLECLTSREPTYWPTDRGKIPDLLDFFITKNISRNYMSIEACTDLSSDHTPVILNVSTTVLLVQPMKRLYNKSTNWDMYQEVVERKVKLRNPIKTITDIEETVESINKIIHEAANASTKPRKKLPLMLNQYPKTIKEKISERRNLRKIWQRTRYPADKAAFNRASNELKNLTKSFKNYNLQTYLSNLTPSLDTNYSLWKATSKLKRPNNQIPPIRKTNGNWARSDKEKAKIFAEYLIEVFKPLPELRPERDTGIKNYLKSAQQMCLPIKHVSPTEVYNEIKHLKDGKSPGYDLIDSTLLKNLPKKGTLAIANIFNACIRHSHFPGQWKIAQVIMLPKPGKPPNEASAYRPISLLPLIGKLFEKILLKRMKAYLNDIIPEHQFGFRENHGTIEQVHRIVDVISRSLEEKKYCSAVFLDISQAFDRVWHEGLLYKVKKMLPHSFYNILHSYLSGRCFEIKLNEELSDLYDIKSGVPQGSILGPVLYTLFTADLPTTDSTMVATYADDTAILSSHENPITASEHLQLHIDKIEEWLNTWRMQANQSKSTQVTFTLRRGNCPPVTINNSEIPQDNHAKYLGMHMDRRLTWQKHIRTKRKQLDLKLRNMYWLIGRHSQMNTCSKLTVYKAILKPIWTYGIQLWGTASNSNIEILERFQTKTLRVIFNIPQYISNRLIYHDLKLPSVKQEITKYSNNYQTRLAKHKNELALGLSGDKSLRYRRLKRHSVQTLIDRFVRKD